MKKVIQVGVAGIVIVALNIFVFRSISDVPRMFLLVGGGGPGLLHWVRNWVYLHSLHIFLCIVWLLLCCLASFTPSRSAFPLSSSADTPLPFPVNSASTEPLPFPVGSASTEPLPFLVHSASTKQLPFPVNSASTEPLPSPVRSASTEPLTFSVNSALTEPLPSPVRSASTKTLSFLVNSAATVPLPPPVRSACTKPLTFPVNSASTEPLPSPVRSASTDPLPSPVRSASTEPLPFPVNSASTEPLPSPETLRSPELLPAPADSASTKLLPSPADSASTKLLPSPTNSASTESQPSLEPTPSPADSASTKPLPPSADSTSAGRALSLVLSAVSSAPIVCRKYNLVRSLADQILNRNLGSGVEELLELNRAALAVAFARTIALLEVAIETEVCLASGLWPSWAVQATDEQRGASAEKLAAETMWLGQKMAESRAASKAVTMWGSMVRLPVLAISVKPSLRNLIVRVGEFMFTLIHSEELEGNSTSSRLAMLKAWLPLLCQLGKEPDTVRILQTMIEKFPHKEQDDILSLAMLKAWLPLLCQLGKKADAVRLLERKIKKFTHEGQGDILSLWLRHYTSCSDFNCLNLENSYMRWYSESEKLNLK
ncbi:helicase SRCAP-like [Zingiber officinale]|uniref:Uncharacterized protein n=1 Tax=Zingiber officinale TaxID=94328 RepID=A0A8J5K8U9_ZINOF|nr:helicase SRCAP-like [Zingiber officinale]KAG6476040.1 hypothetical protein ZIOFF_065275 [Zingiber officinale]